VNLSSDGSCSTPRPSANAGDEIHVGDGEVDFQNGAVRETRNSKRSHVLFGHGPDIKGQFKRVSEHGMFRD